MYGNLKSTQISTFQIYTGKKYIPRVNLTLLKNNIAEKETQRVLGVIFNAPRLSLNALVKMLKDDCSKRLCILRSISSNRWGASRNLLRRVYITFIRSKLEYGSIVLDELTEFQLQKLNVIQNQGCQMWLILAKVANFNKLWLGNFKIN